MPDNHPIKNKTIYNFSADKNRWLIDNRSVSFEEIIAVLNTKGSVNIIQHPNGNEYPHQEMIVVEFHDYIYVVPFVDEDDGAIFFTTISPRRKLTKK